MKERIWIVGGSSGIGLELVKEWLNKEHDVVVSARKASDSKALFTLKNIYDTSLEMVDMDVTSMVFCKKLYPRHGNAIRVRYLVL